MELMYPPPLRMVLIRGVTKQVTKNKNKQTREHLWLTKSSAKALTVIIAFTAQAFLSEAEQSSAHRQESFIGTTAPESARNSPLLITLSKYAPTLNSRAVLLFEKEKNNSR